ncbi:Uncharacterised protein [Yersinia intermedia]|nr:Uncharacterised protein [Yersinia intermedia]CQD77855.1 Uncharacterised protein [Yersinia intermedia]
MVEYMNKCGVGADVIVHGCVRSGIYKTLQMSISELSSVLHVDRETLTKRIKKHKVNHLSEWRGNRLYGLHEVAKIAWTN